MLTLTPSVQSLDTLHGAEAGEDPKNLNLEDSLLFASLSASGSSVLVSQRFPLPESVASLVMMLSMANAT